MLLLSRMFLGSLFHRVGPAQANVKFNILCRRDLRSLLAVTANDVSYSSESSLLTAIASGSGLESRVR